MKEPALAIDSLSLALHGKPILRRVSANFGAGEIWSIIGPNGAGKSTLLKCLMRIHPGWTGRVRLRGRDLAGLSQRELARQMAYVPQAGGSQAFPFTVREFVQMGRYAWSGFFGAPHPADREAVASAIRRAGLEPFANRALDTLSGGERQKVFLAAALAPGSGILLLDEPAAFLDYRHQAEVAGILRRLNRECGVTIVSVTHDVNAAIQAGGHVLALREGEAVWEGLAYDLPDASVLQSIFETDFRFLEDPATGQRLVVPQGERVSA